MTEKYILTSPNFEGEIVLEFSLEGTLRSFKNDATLNEVQLDWLSKNFPMNIQTVNEIIKKSKMKATYIPAEVTFEQFWDEYDYKVDKAQAKKVWDKMKTGEKLAAVNAIKSYKFYLQSNPGISKIYPERYLKNKRWEVDYIKLVKGK
jgi:hypothetical protein